MSYIIPKSVKKIRQEKRTYMLIMTAVDLIIFVFIAVMVYISQTKDESKHKVLAIFAIACVVLGLITALGFIHSSRYFKKIKNILGANSDDELDSILRSGTVVTAYIYITKDYFVNLNSERIYPLSKINKAYPYEKTVRGNKMSKLYVSYNIKLYLTSGSEHIAFPDNERARDEALSKIIAASSCKLEEGYQSIIS